MRRLLIVASFLALVGLGLPSPGTPAAVAAPPRPQVVSLPLSISAGEYHSCGVTAAGVVNCWGSNSDGQTAAPTGTFSAVSAGQFHTCGRKSNGTLACWGDDTNEKASPPTGTFLAVGAGRFHSCGLKSDGTLVCWGSNNYSQLNAPTGTFKALTAGAAHNCAIASNNTVSCWGNNAYNQASPPPDAVKQIDAGTYDTCAIYDDDTVGCWGDSTFGETDTPTGTFLAVSAGDTHACAIKTDQTIACWGNNADGQATAPSGTFVAVSAGTAHTCAVNTEGGVICWGSSTYGQLTPTAAAFVVGGIETPREAGASATISVHAVDAFGSSTAGYRGKVHFTSTDTKAALPADYTFTEADAGAHAFTVTLKTAGLQAVRARDTVKTAITGIQQGISVTPAPLSALALTGISTPRTAGVTANLTVKAVDAYGNTIPSYLGTITFTSTDTQAVLPADYTFTPGDAGAHTFAAGIAFKTAGLQAVRARDTVNTTLTGLLQKITVNPAAAATLAVSGIADPFAAGLADGFTVTAKDAYGNTATGYKGTVHFTTTDGAAALPANHTFISTDKGVHTFSVTLRTVGEQAVRARDTTTTTITGIQDHITVQ